MKSNSNGEKPTIQHANTRNINFVGGVLSINYIPPSLNTILSPKTNYKFKYASFWLKRAINFPPFKINEFVSCYLYSNLLNLLSRTHICIRYIVFK